ncbi:MAG: glycosyltransferase family 4 protein [Candidatus Komeilibacteria bacterium]
MSKNKPLKIGIDARMYGPRSRGLGRYVQQLVDHLAQLDTYNEYYILLGPHNWDDFQTKNKNFVKILVKSHWYSWREQIFLPLLLWRLRLDIMHWPHFNVPLLYRGSFIVTIHDLIMSHYPDSRATTLPAWLYWLKLQAYRFVLRHAIIKSSSIITVSHFTKQDIERYYPQVMHKISVTHLGFAVDHQISQPVDLSHYGIDRPYILYVGAAYPHKNLYRLLQAWKLLQPELKDAYQLVLVGQRDWFYQTLQDESREQQLDRNVVFTGYIYDKELPIFYQFSLAYIFPSYLEGFGLPAIEAQSYGIPVLAANNSSLPEVLAESAVYFDPFDINDIAAKMAKVISNEDLRDKLKQAGYKNTQRFDWNKLAQQTKQIYTKVGQWLRSVQ